jgi:hypothetical protein
MSQPINQISWINSTYRWGQSLYTTVSSRVWNRWEDTSEENKKTTKKVAAATAVGIGVGVTSMAVLPALTTVAIAGGSNLLAFGYGLTVETATYAPHIIAAGVAGKVTLSALSPANPQDKYCGSAELSQLDPNKAIKALAAKVNAFRTKQPLSCLWVDPDIEIIRNLSEEDLNKVRTELKKLGPEANDSHRVEEVKKILKFKIDLPLINSSLVGKIEAIPIQSQTYTDAKKETDKQLGLFVKNASRRTVLFLIHYVILGFKQTTEIDTAFKEILKKLSESDNNSLSLWDTYRKYLGKDLNFVQKIKAKSAYFIFCTALNVPNIIDVFVTKIISEFRKKIESDNPGKLNLTFTTLLLKATELLQVYIDVPEKYAADVPRADAKQEPLKGNTLASWMKSAIEALGDKYLYEKVMATRAPGQDIGKKMMNGLCTTLINNLVNECFPRVKLFESLKATTLLRVRIGIIFDAFDWIFGGVFNFFFREFSRFFLPGTIQLLIESGVDKTLPGQYSYKIAIANSIATQITALHEDLKKPTVNKPQEKVNNEQIDGVVRRLITALNLQEIGENPTRDQISKFIATQDNWIKNIVNNKLRDNLVNSSQLFIYLYSKKPEKVEKLFGDLLCSANNGFEVNASMDTESHFNNAMNGLETACDNLVMFVTKDLIHKTLRGPNEQTFNECMDEIYSKQRAKVNRPFETLFELSQSMQETLNMENSKNGTSLLQKLSHFTETLGEFATHSASIKIELYSSDIQKKFHQTFLPIYHESISLAEKAIELQIPEMLYDKQVKLVQEFQELQSLIEKKTIEPGSLEQKLSHLRKTGNLYNEKISFDTTARYLNQYLIAFDTHIKELKNVSEAEEKERLIINNLRMLEDPDQFIINLLTHPRKLIEKLKKTIPITDQAELFPKIQALQTAPTQISTKDELNLKECVKKALKNILIKHDNLRKENTLKKEKNKAHFKNVTEEVLKAAKKDQEQSKLKISDKLTILAESTKTLCKKIDETKVPKLELSLLQKNIPDFIVKLAKDWTGKVVLNRSDNYRTAIFKLITSNDIYQGAVRLAIGAVNESFPKKPAGRSSSLFQWVARKTVRTGNDE